MSRSSARPAVAHSRLRSAARARRAEVVALVLADAAVVTLACGALPVSEKGRAAVGAAALLAGACCATKPKLTLRVAGDVARLGVLLTAVALAGATAASVPLTNPGLVTVLAATVAGRVASHRVLRLVRRVRPSERAVIVGADGSGVQLAELLREHPELGVRAIGFVDETDCVLPLPVLGRGDRLDGIACDAGASRVFVAGGVRSGAGMGTRIRACLKAGIVVHVVADLLDASHRVADDEVWGVPLVTMEPPPAFSAARAVKRAADVVLSVLALAAAAPLVVAITLAIRATSPGPVLFRQRRVGLDGRTFGCLKFRTLPINDDSDSRWSVAGDRSVPSLGRLLRATGLDEIPQLLNVIRGDMSLVGPRPERPYFVERFSSIVPGYADRHRVRPGLTGWAQVHGLRGDTSIADRARFDNRYIDTWSLWQDALILVRTATAIVRHSAVEILRRPAERGAALVQTAAADGVHAAAVRGVVGETLTLQPQPVSGAPGGGLVGAVGTFEED